MAGIGKPQKFASWLFIASMLWSYTYLKCSSAQVQITIFGKAFPEVAQADKWRICASSMIHAILPKDTAKVAGLTNIKADGSFEIEVTAKPGELIFVGAYYEGILACSSVTPIRVLNEGGKRIELAHMRINPIRATVEIALQNPDGSHLSSAAKVHIYNLYGEVTANTDGVRTDEKGTLRIDGLPSGLYDIWVESVDGDKEGKFARSLFKCVEISAGEGKQRIELRLQRGGAIRGRLIFADGKPASGCIISVQTGTFLSERTLAGSKIAAYAHGAIDCYSEAVVQDDGTFTLSGLTEGMHCLDVRLPGDTLPSHTVNDIPIKAGQMIDVGVIRLTDERWKFMFDGQTLSGWKESDFFGKNEVRIENDRIVMLQGNDMTGVTWTGELPRIDYEVTLQGMRVDGSDFFCGLTFPVGDDHCSLILGGWGGSVVGLSCIDGFDASQNETTRFIQFQNGRWYRIRLRVTRQRIEAWLDSQKIIDVGIEGRKISIRWECEPSIPFGIATWRTTGAIRDIRIRGLE